MIRTPIQRQKSFPAKAVHSAPAGMGIFCLIHSAYFGRMTGGGLR
jgi:TRAP-type C4-dicarboxylate transport system permease large subunit